MPYTERSRKRDGVTRDGDSVVGEEDGVSREGGSYGATPEAGHAGEEEKSLVEVEDGEGEGERGGVMISQRYYRDTVASQRCNRNTTTS